jgi:hypothetical protein
LPGSKTTNKKDFYFRKSNSRALLRKGFEERCGLGRNLSLASWLVEDVSLSLSKAVPFFNGWETIVFSRFPWRNHITLHIILNHAPHNDGVNIISL